MVLHLINKTQQEYNENMQTCQTHCLYFDEITGKCGYYNNEVPHDPLFTAKCKHFIDEEDWNQFTEGLISEVEEKVLLEYPYIPPKRSSRDDAIWYVSKDGEYGCWIISLTKKKRIMPINTLHIDDDMIKSGRYRSPYPLHNHGQDAKDASRIAWVIDEKGIGQYAWLIGGDIIYT